MEQETGTRGERIRKASRRRRNDQKEELRQIIIKAASELFLKQGYDGFSMRHLAEDIGYSPATLYLYFRDKDDLLFTVVDEGFQRFEQVLRAAVTDNADPWARLTALGKAYVNFGLHNPAYYQLMFLWRADFLMENRPGEEHSRLKTFQILQEAVQNAQEAGVLIPGNPESYSDTFWAAIHGAVSLAIIVPTFDETRLQQLITATLDMLFRAYVQS